MIWVFIAIVGAGLIIAVERLWLNPEVLLTAEDTLAAPGRPLRFVALLERDIFFFIDPPIRGATVEFFEEDRRLGSAVTGADGYAVLEAGGAGEPGERRIRAVHGGASALFLVRIVPKEAPILVCDLDHTVADISAIRYAITPNEKVPALAGAERVLPRLGERFTLVYLTARDHVFSRKTKEWFPLKGLPESPVLLRRKRFWSQSPFAHKMDRLTELAREHRLAAGVGDLDSDMEAYRRHGMNAYLMSPSGRGRAEKDVTVVKDWEDLAQHLLRD
ncbi:MAG: hypothetical protein HY716_08885 [Planctomycetes bacterium]|nr:hypothetical protein [Planctomycetota bacterium]